MMAQTTVTIVWAIGFLFFFLLTYYEHSFSQYLVFTLTSIKKNRVYFLSS